MPLLNYTTSVPVSRTLAVIHTLLASAGAASISTAYAVGKPSGVAFEILTPYGLRNFVLPVNAERVEKVLCSERVAPKYQTPEHAERVAWRILKDWLEAQLAVIRADTASLDQVMLPYMRADNGQTVYELYRDQQLALGTGD